MKSCFCPFCNRSCVKKATSQRYSLENKIGDRMIKQLLNSVIAKYHDLSVSHRSIFCLSLQLQHIIDLLATEKSRYFAQPRPIIVNSYSTLYKPVIYQPQIWQGTFRIKNQ